MVNPLIASSKTRFTFAVPIGKNPNQKQMYNPLKSKSMGTISKGILGGFSGKVGTVVGANWKGIDIIRSLPKKGSRVATELQAIQRLKFGLVIRFLSPLTTVLRAYYGNNPNAKSRSNLAVSYHVQDAIAGAYPEFAMDFTKVIVAKGDLLGLGNAQAAPQATAEIAFSWEDNAGQGLALGTDQLVVVAHNEQRNLSEIRDQVASRSALAYTMSFPDSWVGDTVHCYVTFASEDGKKNGLSVYMGPQVLV
jgi:hypothetical protein